MRLVYVNIIIYNYVDRVMIKKLYVNILIKKGLLNMAGILSKRRETVNNQSINTHDQSLHINIIMLYVDINKYNPILAQVYLPILK